MNNALKTFTDLVHKMRLAQERYFELAVAARKNNIHTKEKKDALVIAKNLEKQVDESIKALNSVPCSGNCGMNYCDENGCVERKPKVETSPVPQSYFNAENF